MSFIYTEEQESIRELVKEFAKNELEPRAPKMDQEEKLDPEVIKMMAEMGLMGIGIPEEYGGLGMGVMEKSIVVEELARKDAATAELISVQNMAYMAILKHGSEELKQKYLTWAAQGGICAFALTEPSAGSDAANIKTTAVVDGDEYVINGSTDDEKNYRSCRNRLFIARNILNLASIYKDPQKVELITAVAEAITPGPLGLATQALIAEAWAALETEEDLDELYHDGRVPVIKSEGQWKTSPEKFIKSKELRKKLDDESKELLDEKSDEIADITDGVSTVTHFRDGLNYDEYLMLMILSVNENVRLLRIMDLVQINMKYRYYRDFNLMEYYTGTRFTLEVNGKSHEFEDAYK